jgi:flagellar basal-body rod modification protein FlgD
MALDLSGLSGVKTTENSGTATTTGTKGKTTQLDQNQFLQLMIAQMKNQDPTKPMDPSTFMSQLAQFSQVTGIEEMNKSVGNLNDSLLSSQVLSGTNLVGHEILAQSDTAVLAAQGGKITGAVDVPSGSQNVRVAVINSAGQLVKTMAINPGSGGMVDFQWDGKATDGSLAPAGTYGFQVLTGSGEDTTQLNPLLSSHVNSVTIDGTTHELSLNTNNGTLAMSTVRRIM